MDIGFVGTGNMGSGMVESLLRRGHRVTVFNRTPSKAQRLTELGANPVRSIAEACRFPVVFTMLADDQALEEVTLGTHGLLESLPEGAIHVSSGTVSVSLAQRLAQSHSGARRGFVSAPVFGRPDAAASDVAATSAESSSAPMRLLKWTITSCGVPSISMSVRYTRIWLGSPLRLTRLSPTPRSLQGSK
jgi:3-hydroxyisobutyrate dehydrogenase-like beta-hydroxyacid dehydrogenase